MDAMGHSARILQCLEVLGGSVSTHVAAVGWRRRSQHMRTGVITTALLDRSLDEALDYVHTLGVRTVEIPAAGGF